MQNKQFAVVDDLVTDRTALVQKVDEYMQSHDLPYQINEYESGERFLAEFRTKDFDVVFMDIYMEGMDGLAVASQVRAHDHDCKLVFLTSVGAHVFQALSLGICHYLVKPIKDDEFEAAMKNCCVLPNYAVPFLEVMVEKEPLTIDTAKIIYIEKIGRVVCVHMTQQTLELNEAVFSVQKVTGLLAKDERFLVPIRGVVLNMDRVDELVDDGFIMQNGTRIPVNVRSGKAILAAYQHYLMTRVRGVQ